LCGWPRLVKIVPMNLIDVSMVDKYRLERGRVFLTGTQSFVRLALEQRRRDLCAGLNTAGYVTGYRGSPLGGMDREFNNARKILREFNIQFHPAVNEDLAATALWGSQQVNLEQGAKQDGVFGIWYGKGPGVDRSGDVFRHANLAGTAPLGGVLALFGDDPACKSSTVPSQSEYAMIDAQMPFLNPVDVSEVIEYGLIGIAMSRYSGCWIGLKCISDNVDSSASITIDPTSTKIVTPPDFQIPDGGLSIRWPDPPIDQEFRLHEYKLYAAQAFARANSLNRITFDSAKARFGILAAGKAYLDTIQALNDLGIGPHEAAKIGLRVIKVGMPWPLEPYFIRTFTEGLDEVLVIEEKRPVIESQFKELLYNCSPKNRPRVVGKFNEANEPMLPSAGELSPARIAKVIAKRLEPLYRSEAISRHLQFLDGKEAELKARKIDFERLPYFCSGCPHNTSTKVPEGSRAAAGIGCHYMVLWMDRNTSTFTHMGGEGANWIGQAPFTKTEHIFTNLGDGTYFHSGIMAIRAAVAAGVNITYKILYNDAVAMTGGQPMDGPLDVPAIARQIHAEGIQRIAIVTDEHGRYPPGILWPPNITFHDRHEMDVLQREFRDLKGVTAIVYDQTCAAEKRRRRKRGTLPDPAKRVFINEFVCEGCGDCGETSNCVSVTPKETELGRKRAIDQSACNKDFTCVDGFCPSFVTIEGAELKKPIKAQRVNSTDIFPTVPLPTPKCIESTKPYAIIVGGIGGTGVVTISAIIAMAAHISQKGVTVLDMAGLAQKNGAVYAHIRICDQVEKLHSVRISAGGADLLIGCDMVTAGGWEALSKLDRGRTRAIINSHRTMTADFTRNPDLAFPEHDIKQSIAAAVGKNGEECNANFLEATELARKLVGDSIAANLFLIGYAFQKELLPLTESALIKAIELNGVAVEINKQAFQWGRFYAVDPTSIEALVSKNVQTVMRPKPSRDEFIERRIKDLTDYQNATYADRYREMVEKVIETERSQIPESDGALAEAVAQSYFKLLAIKDEYEVARLYTDGRFQRAIEDTFEAYNTLKLHLAPPFLAKVNPSTGFPIKKMYGFWMFKAFRLLAKFKVLRGTFFDPFAMTEERKQERKDIHNFETVMQILIDGVTSDTYHAAIKIATLPQKLRGFGHIKDQARQQILKDQQRLMRGFLNGNDMDQPKESHIQAAE